MDKNVKKWACRQSDFTRRGLACFQCSQGGYTKVRRGEGSMLEEEGESGGSALPRYITIMPSDIGHKVFFLIEY